MFSESIYQVRPRSAVRMHGWGLPNSGFQNLLDRHLYLWPHTHGTLGLGIVHSSHDGSNRFGFLSPAHGIIHRKLHQKINNATQMALFEENACHARM